NIVTPRSARTSISAVAAPLPPTSRASRARARRGHGDEHDVRAAASIPAKRVEPARGPFVAVDQVVDVVHVELARAVLVDRLANALEELRELLLVVRADALARCAAFRLRCIVRPHRPSLQGCQIK